VVLHQSEARAKWKTVSMDELAGKPIFKIQPPPTSRKRSRHSSGRSYLPQTPRKTPQARESPTDF